MPSDLAILDLTNEKGDDYRLESCSMCDLCFDS